MRIKRQTWRGGVPTYPQCTTRPASKFAPLMKAALPVVGHAPRFGMRDEVQALPDGDIWLLSAIPTACSIFPREKGLVCRPTPANTTDGGGGDRDYARGHPGDERCEFGVGHAGPVCAHSRNWLERTERVSGASIQPHRRFARWHPAPDQAPSRSLPFRMAIYAISWNDAVRSSQPLSSRYQSGVSHK